MTNEKIYSLSVQGGKLAVISVGSGPAVLFLHGGPGDTHHYMKRMAAPLLDQFHCIFFDQRGTGGSSGVIRRSDQFQIGILLDDLAQICRFFQLSTPALVGHSWGGTYGLYALMEYPDLFSRAALLSMGPVNQQMSELCNLRIAANFTEEEKNDWRWMRQERNLARDRGEREKVAELDRKLMRLRVKDWIFHPKLREAFLEEYFQDPAPDREVNKWIWENQQGYFSPEKLSKIKAKIWLAQGANDYIPPEQMELIIRAVTTARSLLYPNCGHIPWLEAADFYSDLKQFLA